MAKKQPNGPKPPDGPSQLDPKAEDALGYFTAKVRELLLENARKSAKGLSVSGDDIEEGYFSLIDPNRMKGIQQIIDTALRENRVFEYATYAMILGLFALGSFLLYTGMTRPSDAVAQTTGVIGGSVAQVLVLPALRYAIGVRRHNISIRMLGALVAASPDLKSLSPVIKDLLKSILRGDA